jgi:hypothetical protein
MAVKHNPPKPPKVIAAGGEAAPFVYFDGATAYAHRDGVFQIELAATHLVAFEDAKGEERVTPKVVVVSHLRGSRNALENLAKAVDALLDMTTAREEAKA